MVALILMCAWILQHYFPAWRLPQSLWQSYVSHTEHLRARMTPSGPLASWVVMVLPIWLVVVLLVAISGALIGDLIESLVILLLLYSYVKLDELKQDNQCDNAVFLLGLFTPVFWYSISGFPIFFFVIVLLVSVNVTEREVLTERCQFMHDPARFLLCLFAWLPARLLGLLIACFSRFSEVMAVNASSLRGGVFGTLDYLESALTAALAEKGATDQSRQKRQLLQKVCIAWLAILLVYSLGVLHA